MLVSEIINIQKYVIKNFDITKKLERCDKCSLYENMANAVYSA